MARRPRCLSGAAFVLEPPCPISPTLRNVLPLLLLVQNFRFLSPEASSNSSAARPSSPSLLEFLPVGICSFPLLGADLAPCPLTKGVLGSTVSSSQGKESLQPSSKRHPCSPPQSQLLPSETPELFTLHRFCVWKNLSSLQHSKLGKTVSLPKNHKPPLCTDLLQVSRAWPHRTPRPPPPGGWKQMRASQRRSGAKGVTRAGRVGLRRNREMSAGAKFTNIRTHCQRGLSSLLCSPHLSCPGISHLRLNSPNHPKF